MFDKEYVFYGKHADIVKKLTSPLTSNIKKKLFENNIDVYVVAPLIGYLYNEKLMWKKVRILPQKFLETKLWMRATV